MKKNYFMTFLLIILFIANSSRAMDGPPPQVEPGKPSTQTTILGLGVDVIKLIGQHSGNSLALKTTCSTLHKIEFKKKDMYFVMRHSVGFQRVLQTLPTGNPDVTALNLWGDVRTLNCYNMTLEDFATLFPNSESIPGTLKALRGHPATPIKRIILRTAYDDFDKYRPLPDGLLKTIEHQDVTLCFIRERYSSDIDNFFVRNPLTEEMLLNLLRMTSFDRGSGSLFSKHQNGFDLSQYIRGNSITEDPAYLEHVLRTHGEIVADTVAYSLTRACRPAMPYVHGILRTEQAHNGVQVLEAIRDILLLQLCHGPTLFEGTDGKRLCQLLSLVCHDETSSILQLLRQFIPPYVPGDYIDEPGKPWHGMFDLERGGRSDPCEEGKILTYRDKKLDRADIFKGFIVALSGFNSKQQLVRLNRLLHVLNIKHIRQIETDDKKVTGYGGYYDPNGLVPLFTKALGYIYDSTQDIGATEFTVFIDFFKDKHGNFNPLYPSSEKEFIDIFAPYKKRFEPQEQDVDDPIP